MNLSIVLHPNDILRTKCEDLTEKPSNELIEAMFKLVKEKKGIGLAAPQIGLSQNLFIINTQTDKLVFVNPIITFYSKKECSFEEGCLSLPGELIEIIRPEIIEVSYRDKSFTKRKASFSGINARVIQHELDHLNGKLIIDYYGE